MEGPPLAISPSDDEMATAKTGPMCPLTHPQTSTHSLNMTQSNTHHSSRRHRRQPPKLNQLLGIAAACAAICDEKAERKRRSHDRSRCSCRQPSAWQHLYVKMGSMSVGVWPELRENDARFHSLSVPSSDP